MEQLPNIGNTASAVGELDQSQSPSNTNVRNVGNGCEQHPVEHVNEPMDGDLNLSEAKIHCQNYLKGGVEPLEFGFSAAAPHYKRALIVGNNLLLDYGILDCERELDIVLFQY